MKRISLVFLMVFLGLGISFAQRTVMGTITDAAGEPLIGANIIVKGTSVGTVTDLDGQYSVEVPAGSDMLVISYTGYTSQEITLGASNVVNVTLQEGVILETAVVTALGISKERKSLGYSVEKVGGDELVSSRETNVVNSLAGKVSGVQITNSSGQTGASTRITVRGVSSFLGNNQPLFVIDGVPVDNSMTFGGGQNSLNGTGVGDSPLFYGGTVNRLVDIDPSIIESMSVLKGASATALYGNRGANGVIIITTKNGRKGQKPSVSVSFNYGWMKPRLPEFQNEYAQGLNGNFNPISSSAWGPRIDTLRFNENGQVDPNGTPAQVYDNPAEFFQKGQVYQTGVSLSGGTDNSTYFLAYNNHNEKGILHRNDLNRHSLVAKYGGTLSSKFNYNFGLNFSQTNINSLTEGNGRSAYMWTVYGAPPSYDLRNDDGDGEIGPEDYLNPDGTQRLYRTARNNPYFLIDQNGLASLTNRFLPNVQMEYALTSWLKIANRFGADIYSDTRKYTEAVGTLGDYPQGRVYEDANNYRQFNNDLTLQMQQTLSDSWGFDLLVGSNINEEYSDRLYTQGDDLSIPGFYNLQNASNVTTSQQISRARLLGLYGSLGFDFRRYLYFNITARNDWSSTLEPKNRSFFYPSASASFILTDAIESLQGNSVLSFLKLRASYAQVGNATSPYSTTETIFVQSSIGDGQRGNINVPFNGTNSYTLSNVIGNPDLRSELTTEIEFGLEAQFFNNRIRLEASYYDRLSEDQIFNAPIAGSSGAVSKFVNAGSMRNKGIELMLGATPVKVGGFNWDLNVTFTKNDNNVEELTPGVDNIRLAGFTAPGIYIVKNQPYGVIWGTRYLRDAQNRIIVDSDPNSPAYGTPEVDLSTLGIIGVTQPKWLAGLRNTFSYSSNSLGTFALSAVIDKREGGDVLNFDNFYLNFYGVTKQTGIRDGSDVFVVPNSVKADGTANDIEVTRDQFYWQNVWGQQIYEDLIEDGSFLRLREVTLRYAFPKNLTKSWKSVQDLSVFVTGRNLYLNAPNFTGSDPEVSLYGNANGQGFYNFNTPATIGWNVGLNATF